MELTLTGTPPRATERKREKGVRPPAEINLADFSGLIVGMSRLLFGLAAIPPFKNAELGLAEWVALSVLAERDGMSNKQLAKGLGVTGQRANQIKASLEKAGLISAIQSTADSRQNVITITDHGKTQLQTINSAIVPLIATALKNKERSLAAANKQVKLLMRIVNADRAKEGKKERKREGAKTQGGEGPQT